MLRQPRANPFPARARATITLCARAPGQLQIQLRQQLAKLSTNHQNKLLCLAFSLTITSPITLSNTPYSIHQRMHLLM